jgi:ABC-2 type transport system permease protein
MIVLYRYMPALTAEEGPPALLVYDAGNPVMMALLEDSPAVDLFTYESETQMLYYLSNGEQPELGLVIHAGFDQQIQAGTTLTLQGYMLHFFTKEQVSDLTRYMQDEFEYLIGEPVTIKIEPIELQPDTHGITILASMGFGFVILMVGMIAIPHMMLEEKQHKTMEAMLISPANSLHIVISKALTGLILTVVIFVGSLFLFRYVIVHWGLAMMAGFLGALFAVSFGLLLGILVDTRQQLVLWAWVGLIPIFFPMILSIMDDLLPEWLILIFKWVPSSGLMRALRSSMVGEPPGAFYVPQLALLLVSATLVFAIDIWLIRRMDR